MKTDSEPKKSVMNGLALPELDGQVRQLRHQLDEIEACAVHGARRAARATDQAAHRHPYAAIGMAAAIGALVGALVARRN